MKKARYIIILLILILGFAGIRVYDSFISKPQVENIDILDDYSKGTKVVTGVNYSDDDKERLLDIAYTPDKTKKPLIVCVHGGSWTGGSREEMNDFMYTFSSLGYVVATIDYDLIPEVSMTEQIECIGKAVSYLAENAKEYEINPESVIMLGHSAGAQLAMRFAEMAVEKPERYGCKIAAAVDIAGPVDMERLLVYVDNKEIQNIISNIEIIDGNSESDILAAIKKVDVVQNIPENMPPVLIVQGVEDKRTPLVMSDNFYDELNNLGIKCKYERVDGMEHAIDINKVFPIVYNFLQEVVV